MRLIATIGTASRRPFGYAQYLAVKSAHDVLAPDSMTLHYKHLPTGEWWERAAPYLRLRRIDSANPHFDFTGCCHPPQLMCMTAHRDANQ